ncbi:MAG: ATP-binding protein [Halobacteriovoraceae bacterium]|nr:ATP-binding protein [Halobacteriovoraceae bacterium]
MSKLDHRIQSLILFIFLSGIGFAFQYSLYKEDVNGVKKKTEYLFKVEEGRVKEYLASYSDVLLEYKRVLENKDKFESLEFSKLSKQFWTHFKDIQAFNFVSSKYQIIQVFPEEKNKVALGKNLAEHPDPYVKAVFQKGLSRKSLTFLPPVKIYQGGNAFIFYVPINFKSGDFGWINVVISAENLFSGYKKDHVLLDFDFSVLDEKSKRFFIQPNEEGFESEALLSFSSFLYDRKLKYFFNLEKEIEVQRNQSIKDFLLLFVTLTVLVIFFFLYGKSRDEIYKQYINIQNESNLLKILVHDLSNPIQVVLLGLQSLKVKNQENDKLVKYMEKNQMSAAEVIHTVRKVYKGDVFYEHAKTVKAKSLIEDVLLSLSQDIGALNIETLVEGEEQTNINLKLDSAAFKNHVLKNVLSNAVKFSMRNTQLSIKLSSSKMIIQNKTENINPERFKELNDIRPMESTLDNSNESSLGLGLFIAKIFCQRGGIQLSIEQNPDTGIVSTILVFS